MVQPALPVRVDSNRYPRPTGWLAAKAAGLRLYAESRNRLRAVRDESVDMSQTLTKSEMPLASASPLSDSPPPDSDRTLRRTMFLVGHQLHSLMVANNKLPEELASDFGISVDTIEQIMLGHTKDLTVAQLAAIAKVFGVNLVVGFTPPTLPSPPTKT